MLGRDPLDVRAAAHEAVVVAQREQVVDRAAGVVEVERAAEGRVVVAEGDRVEGDRAGADGAAAFAGLDVEGEFDRAVLVLQRRQLVEQATGLILQADRGEGGGRDRGVVGPGPVEQAFVGRVVGGDVEGADQLQGVDPSAGVRGEARPSRSARTLRRAEPRRRASRPAPRPRPTLSLAVAGDAAAVRALRGRFEHATGLLGPTWRASQRAIARLRAMRLLRRPGTRARAMPRRCGERLAARRRSGRRRRPAAGADARSWRRRAARIRRVSRRRARGGMRSPCVGGRAAGLIGPSGRGLEAWAVAGRALAGRGERR